MESFIMCLKMSVKYKGNPEEMETMMRMCCDFIVWDHYEYKGDKR